MNKNRYKIEALLESIDKKVLDNFAQIMIEEINNDLTSREDKQRIEELLKKWELILNKTPKNIEDLIIIESEEKVCITKAL